MAIEMASGRELDALIARRIFGLHAFVTPGMPWWADGMLNGHVRTGADGTGGYTHLPEFSTEIAAAWLVVEHLRSAGFAPLLMFAPADVETDVPCHASLIRSYEEPMDCEIEADAETMPLAICRVALMADEAAKGE